LTAALGKEQVVSNLVYASAETTKENNMAQS
jgi:hypothetical protein